MTTKVIKIGTSGVLTGDCMELMPALTTGSVKTVVTSPPYNLGVDYGNGADKDKKAASDYVTWIVAVFSEVRRLLRDDGNVFLNIAGSSTQPSLPNRVIIALEDDGWALQNSIIWVKAIDDRGHFKPVPGKRFLHRQWEHVFHLTKTGGVDIDRLAAGIEFSDKSNIARRGHADDRRCRGNTWFIPYDTICRRRLHPAPFPLELPRRCLKLSGPGLVMDPFSGSGTTLLAAAELGMPALGIELSADYVTSAVRSLKGIG